MTPLKGQSERITRAVLKQLEPTPIERRRADHTFALIRNRILAKASQLGIKVKVEEVGSVGKDTWIRGEADLDTFIVFPEGSPSLDVEKYGLELGKYASKGKYIISYAEHPYTRARVNGFDVDIVPCVGVKDANHIITAVDRTPFHKRFVIKQLNPKLREAILLLKRFMTTVGVYGAEIKVGGFSGYLAELLVIYYGGFEGTLRAAGGWREGVLIDLQGAYENPEDARIMFESNVLIVVDPVDRGRNVAAAVTSTKMALFVTAAREFMELPSRLYFNYSPAIIPAASISKMISRQEIQLVGVEIGCPRLVSDVLWGQLHKSLSGLITLFELHGFSVVYSDVWTDEALFVVFIFQLVSLELPAELIREGPSVYMRDETERFLHKHFDSRKVIIGPWIEGNRWRVELRREITQAEDLLNQKLMTARLGPEIEKMAQTKKRIEVGTKVLALANRTKSFNMFLSQFLRRRPIWLEWRSRPRQKNI